MNNNYILLTHAIEVLRTSPYVSTNDAAVKSCSSTKDLIIDSHSKNPNPVSEHMDTAIDMMKLINELAITEFDRKVVSIMESDEDNSEGIVAYIPILYESIRRRGELMDSLTHPEEFYPLERYQTFDGSVKVVMINDLNLVHGVTDSGHLITWYESKSPIPVIGDVCHITGQVTRKIYEHVPWQVRLTKVKYK